MPTCVKAPVSFRVPAAVKLTSQAKLPEVLFLSCVMLPATVTVAPALLTLSIGLTFALLRRRDTIETGPQFRVPATSSIVDSLPLGSTLCPIVTAPVPVPTVKEPELEIVSVVSTPAMELLTTSVLQDRLSLTVTASPARITTSSVEAGNPDGLQVMALQLPVPWLVLVTARPVDVQRKVATSGSIIRANAHEPRMTPERADSVVRGSSAPIKFFISFQIASSKESSRRPSPATVEVPARQSHQHQPAAFPALFSS